MKPISFPSPPPPSRRHALAIVYLSIAMTVIFLFASLAIDYARVQVARTELQIAVDAAARYAALGLSDGTYFTKASAAASANIVDTTPLTLLAADVVIGNYSAGVFTAAGSPTNAVQVNGQRSAARGNAIPVLFALRIVSSNCTASAIASASGGNNYGAAALSSAIVNGSLLVDSYNSSIGSYASTQSTSGSIASAGSWTLSTAANIEGNLYYTGTQPTNGTVTGSRSVLPTSPSLASQYPVIAAPNGATSEGNYNGGALNLTSGNYNFTSFTLNSGDTLTISGSVNIYVSGNINLNGTVINNGVPANLQIYNSSSAGVNISANVVAEIYAPNSPVNLNGTTNIYGTIVAGQLSTSGGQAIHVDSALIGKTITTVK